MKPEVPEDSRIDDVIFLLGCFHTVLNVQGGIGTLMGDGPAAVPLGARA